MRKNLFGTLTVLAGLAILISGCMLGDSIDTLRKNAELSGGGNGGGQTGGGNKDLTGTIYISPSTGVNINTELTANYSGSETVSYQWKNGAANVGANSNKFTPTTAGSYTVTISASGYNSKTSAAVTVSDPSFSKFNSYLIIQNNYPFTFQLIRGTSILSPDNLSSSLVNSGERAQYTIDPGMASPYKLLVGADFKPFPDITFDAGHVYNFVFDGEKVSLVSIGGGGSSGWKL